MVAIGYSNTFRKVINTNLLGAFKSARGKKVLRRNYVKKYS